MKRVVEKDITVLDKSLLSNSLEVPKPPKGKTWSHELAGQLHNQGKAE